MMKIVLQEDSLSHCLLNNFYLAKRFSLECIYMRMRSCEREKYSQLIEEDI